VNPVHTTTAVHTCYCYYGSYGTFLVSSSRVFNLTLVPELHMPQTTLTSMLGSLELFIIQQTWHGRPNRRASTRRDVPQSVMLFCRPHNNVLQARVSIMSTHLLTTYWHYYTAWSGSICKQAIAHSRSSLSFMV